jgi:signal transduction histidine kinase/CheY-like chemotaxis protein
MGQGRDLAGLRRDGTEFPVEVGLSSFASGDRRYVIAVVADITARKALEERLHQAQKMESIGRLAGGVAHDFNNLLTVISGFADMLALELPGDGTLQGDVAAIKGAAEQATALTQQLLAFSRRQMLQPRVLDLNEAVRRLEPMLGRLIGEHIQLAIDLEDEAGTVRVDPAQLEQVVLNLAINARDAMPDGGRLTIATRSVELDPEYALTRRDVTPGHYAMLTVRDTGIGMDEATAQRIFEPFFTTKELGHGTGLGLATIYGSVRQHGGHVAVESAPGKGSVFSVYLPLAEETAGAPDASTSGALPVGHETILVVEDSPGVRELTRTVLARQGYTVLTATRGDEAILAIEEVDGRIDLLVTDVVMPGMSGFALAAAAREMIPGLRTLFLSGYAEEALGPEARVSKPDAFLAKPFTPDTLARRVHDMLRARARSNRARRPQGSVDD